MANASISKTKQGLQDSVSSAEGNSVSTLRIRRDTIIRRLSSYEERVVDLRYNETIIKARLYNNSSFADVDTRLKAGKGQRVSLVQAMAPMDTNPNAEHQSLYFALARTELNIRGFKEMKSEADRIEAEILELGQRINAYNKELKEITNKLADQNGDITLTKVYTDKILRAKYASVYFLYQTAQKYRDLTSVDPQTKQRRFPDNERKRANTLVSIMQTFGAMADSFPQYTLDREDPGSDKNMELLGIEMARMQSSVSNKDITTIEKETKKFSAVIQSTIQDRINSQGVASAEIPSADPADQVRVQTANYVVAQGSFFGNPFNIGALPTIGEAVKKAHKKKVGDTVTLPPCDPAEANNNLSEADKGALATDAKEAVATSNAQVEAKKQQDAAAGVKPDATTLVGQEWWAYFDTYVGKPGIESKYVIVPHYVLYPNETGTRQAWLITAAEATSIADASAAAGAGFEGYPEDKMHMGGIPRTVHSFGPGSKADSTAYYSVYLLKYIATMA